MGDTQFGYLSLQQDFHVTGRLAGFAGATVSYVGDRVGTFKATSERQIFPAYAQANLRAGKMYDSWTANLFFIRIAAASSQVASAQSQPTASSVPSRARSDWPFRGRSETVMRTQDSLYPGRWIGRGLEVGTNTPLH